MKVEFVKTTYDTKSGRAFKIGQIADIEEDFYNRCLELGSVRKVIDNLIEEQLKELEEKTNAAKEEELRKQEEVEKLIEKELIKQEEEFNLTEYVKGLKLVELKEFAKTNNINLKGKTKKAEILDIILAEIHKG